MNDNPEKNLKPGPSGDFVIYTSDDGNTRVECRFENETIWLTQALMAELFQTTPQNITLHLKALYEDGEIGEQATCKEYLQVQQEGSRNVRRQVKHYNLEAILAVGFRVRSNRGTQFRRWANTRLKEYLVKGFVMDDERLKNPAVPGSAALPDYYDELLERIRDIRTSERRMYLRVKELFKLAADYEAQKADTAQFFRIIQNKLHFAATGQTAAELIHNRADASLPNMGLTVWKGEIVRKHDVTVAKNYLTGKEIDELNRIVVMWLDYAEDQTTRRKQIYLHDWEQKLDEFLRFNERSVLPDAGAVSKDEADLKAGNEYNMFMERRRTVLENEGGDESIKQLEDIAKHPHTG